MFKKWSCVSALMACLAGQGLIARNIFVTSPDPATATLSLYTTEPMQPLLFVGAIAGPAGSTQVIAGPGGKYFVLGTTAAEAATVLQGTFPALQTAQRIPLPGVPTNAVLSPNGRRLVVSYAAGLQIIDTTTNAALTTTTGLNVGVSAPSVAISTDSRRLYVTSQQQQRVIVLNLESGARVGEIVVEGEPTAVSVGPNTLLYVSVRNAIYEYDPETLQLRGTFSLNGQPGPLTFSPDARLAIATNSLTVIRKSGFVFDLLRRTVTDVPLTDGITFSKVLIADNTTAFALSRETSQVYAINLLSAGTAPTAYSVPGLTLDGVRDIALSNETPQANSLIILRSGELYKIDIASNTFIGPIQAPLQGMLSFAAPPTTGDAATLLPINASQTVAAGGSSLPIRVRAVNSQGVPLSGVPVTFATEAPGITLSVSSATTDLLGYAQSVVTIPSTQAAGRVPVNATASGQTTAFSLNVSNSSNPGPGPEPTTGGLRIVSGQGQVISAGVATTKPLTVQVVDASGAPVPNVQLTWTVTQGGGALSSDASAFTDAEGMGRASFINAFVPPAEGHITSNIAVTAGTETVNFFVSAVAELPNGARGEPQFSLRKPTDRVITVRAGQTIPEAIQVVVSSLLGRGIPNVGIRLEPEIAGGPSATCRDGAPLSNNAGLVSCDLIGGAILGEGTLRAYVGESAIYTFTLRVEPGVASNIRIIAGNNQTGAAGQALPTSLTVQVTDAGGNPLAGQTVAWEVVTTGSATLSPATSTTDENGRASTRVTLGQQPGAIQIRARVGTASVTFSQTAQASASRLEVTGGGQSTAAGTAFANPLTATVLNAQGQPVAGATVQFLVTSGQATVPATAVTNGSGVATVNVTAGATPGPLVVRATFGTLTQNINLTVSGPGPVFTPSSFVSGAGYQPGISPGSIAVINATGIAPGIRGSVTPQSIIGPLPTSLAGVEVLFNNVAAPIYSVSNINGQESVIVQVPFETAPGAASVTIRVAGSGSTTVQGVAILPVKPSFFDFADTNARRYVVALRPDGTYVTSANPARRGETVRVFATGLGQTTPTAATNRGGVRDQNVNATVIAGINNEGVRLVSAKMVEGSIGVYVVEMEVPATATTGDARPIAIGVAGPDGALVYASGAIPIQ